MSFGERVLQFNYSLQPDWSLPPDVELLYPFSNPDTQATMSAFYNKYYADDQPRIGIFGINPGRFGAGVTGIPFTDPKLLLSACGIDNPFAKKPELSSDFIYRLIDRYGGPTAFYRTFYISSLCPLGFTKDGKNYNYYDEKPLQQAVEPHILANIRAQLELGVVDQVALCLGQGKNWKYFEKINAEHSFFKKIIPLPHPRWVMQYRRKRLDEFLELCLDRLSEAEGLVNG